MKKILLSTVRTSLICLCAFGTCLAQQFNYFNNYMPLPGSNATGLHPDYVRANKPNIVLIFADDLGYMDTGFTGSDYYETPNIDRLSREGMVFNNAYAGGANCAPSRACLMSGQYTPRHGVYAVGSTSRGPAKYMLLSPISNSKNLNMKNFTIAEALKTAGYATGIFGKWHLGGEKDGTDPLSQGFDVNADPAKKKNSAEDPKGIFSITADACKFITNNKDKPFFAYVAHHAIHSDQEARAETLEKFRKKAKGKYHRDAMYAACTYDFDAGVGQLLACLKKLGLEKNTLVIFTSDNGGVSSSPQEPLRGNKGAYYEGGIREPFIARWPGKIVPGTITSIPVINQDIFPTFAAVAEIKLPKDKILDGENLLPIFTGQQKSIMRDQIFWHFPGYLNDPIIRGRDSIFRTRPVTVIRKGDYKLLLYHEEWVLKGGWEKRASNNSLELYNLKNDIGERKNLASVQPEKRDELCSSLLKWMKDTNALLAEVKTGANMKIN